MIDMCAYCGEIFYDEQDDLLDFFEHDDEDVNLMFCNRCWADVYGEVFIWLPTDSPFYWFADKDEENHFVHNFMVELA